MAQEMKAADLVWNRAAMDNGGESPSAGDIALATLLYAHGIAMNGGVLHAVEILSEEELSDALNGYRFFGLEKVVNLFSQAKTLYDAGDELDEHELPLNKEYLEYANDSTLNRQFEAHFRSNPGDFTPVLPQ